MRPIRNLVIACVCAALALGTLAAPATAAQKLYLVNGLPGKKLAFCIDGQRVVKALGYGKRAVRTKGGASAKVKILVKGPRTDKCRGKVLGTRTVTFASATVIVTKRAPFRITVLNNTFPAGTNGIGARHFSDIGPVSFSVVRSVLFPATVKGTFVKGGAATDLGAPSQSRRYHAAIFSNAGGVLAGPRIWEEIPGRPRFVILVGTKPGNFRLVSFLV